MARHADRRQFESIAPLMMRGRSEGFDMDIGTEARRLAALATYFVWVGWFFVIYALVAGVFWFIDLASKANINWLQALGASAAAIGVPIFLALLVAGLGHTMRLFALYAGSRSAQS
jgi:hypothetical protein